MTSIVTPSWQKTQGFSFTFLSPKPPRERKLQTSFRLPLGVHSVDKKLTLREAIKIEVEAWTWLAETGRKNKTKWPGWEKYGYMGGWNALCIYKRQQAAKPLGCKGCPYYEKFGDCEAIGSPYSRWLDADTPRQRRSAAIEYLFQLKQLLAETSDEEEKAVAQETEKRKRFAEEMTLKYQNKYSGCYNITLEGKKLLGVSRVVRAEVPLPPHYIRPGCFWLRLDNGNAIIGTQSQFDETLKDTPEQFPQFIPDKRVNPKILETLKLVDKKRDEAEEERRKLIEQQKDLFELKRVRPPSARTPKADIVAFPYTVGWVDTNSVDANTISKAIALEKQIENLCERINRYIGATNRLIDKIYTK